MTFTKHANNGFPSRNTGASMRANRKTARTEWRKEGGDVMNAESVRGGNHDIGFAIYEDANSKWSDHSKYEIANDTSDLVTWKVSEPGIRDQDWRKVAREFLTNGFDKDYLKENWLTESSHGFHIDGIKMFGTTRYSSVIMDNDAEEFILTSHITEVSSLTASLNKMRNVIYKKYASVVLPQMFKKVWKTMFMKSVFHHATHVMICFMNSRSEIKFNFEEQCKHCDLPDCQEVRAKMTIDGKTNVYNDEFVNDVLEHIENHEKDEFIKLCTETGLFDNKEGCKEKANAPVKNMLLDCIDFDDEYESMNIHEIADTCLSSFSPDIQKKFSMKFIEKFCSVKPAIKKIINKKLHDGLDGNKPTLKNVGSF